MSQYRKFLVAIVGMVIQLPLAPMLPEWAQPYAAVILAAVTAYGVYLARNTPPVVPVPAVPLVESV